MTTIPVSNSTQAMKTPRPLLLEIDILHPDEEQLVAQSKRQVFEKRRIGMSAKPRLDAALNLFVPMRSGRLPALEKFLRHFLHFDIVHHQTPFSG
ncbi:MAG: hypothetical protein ABFD63_04045 [Smithella sp.]